MRDYQAEGSRWLRQRLAAGRNALLADEMGLGKTCQALRALPRRARAVVTCPASVLMTWRDEAARWRRDLRVVPFDGRPPREGEIATVSYDSLPARIGDDFSQVIVIFDEAHRAKNEDTRRTERVRRLVRAAPGRVWGLTGTPMAGTRADLLGLLTSLDLLLEPFPGGDADFRRADDVDERLRQVMLRRLAGDLLNLPPVRWIDVPCAAPADLREHLDDLSDAWSEEYDADELPPFELYSAATAALAKSRAKAARELAAEVARDRPVIVFSAHLAPVRAVASLPGSVLHVGEGMTDQERERSVREFKAGRARIFASTIATGGQGLNLQTAGAVILVDESFNPTDTDQAVKRAARPGQKHRNVLVYRMTTDHPLDKRIREIHDEKRAEIGQTIGA
jgi:superfamily II DNA or RNA helicase